MLEVNKQLQAQKGTKKSPNQAQTHFATKVRNYSHLKKTFMVFFINENLTMIFNYHPTQLEKVVAEPKVLAPLVRQFPVLYYDQEILTI